MGLVCVLMIGTTVSHYRIISHIGAGGMGTVYLAEDTNLKRRVALKFLSPDTASHPDAAARLLREARAASALDHPHIATVYEIGDHAGQPFIAMAHYEGDTLAARLARGPLPMAEVARLVAQVADALAAAHAAGIVHRDLKPSNLMLTTTGQVKVLDFGLAKIEMGETATQLTHAGSTVGTAGYMSPEQAAGDVVDARSDLWSLGIVAYEMLAGRRAVPGHEHAGDHPGGVDGPDRADQNAAARRRPGVGRDREPDAGARPRSAHDHGVERARSRVGLPRAAGVVGTTTGDRATADVAPHAGCGRGHRARRRRQWHRVVGAAQREGPLGAAGGAARDHQARRG